MTQQEFNRWWHDFGVRFPNKASWATSTDTETIKTWREVLEPIELIDALAANKALQAGDAEWPNDWERIPKGVHDVALKMRDRRLAAAYKMDSAAAASEDGNPNWCALCQNSGLVLREDRKGRWFAWACCCAFGGPQMRIRKNRHTGKEWQLVRFTRPADVPNPRRFTELDSYNEEVGF